MAVKWLATAAVGSFQSLALCFVFCFPLSPEKQTEQWKPVVGCGDKTTVDLMVQKWGLYRGVRGVEKKFEI